MNNEQIKMMLTLLNEILLQLRKQGSAFGVVRALESADYTQNEIDKMCATEQNHTKSIDISSNGSEKAQCGEQSERVTVTKRKSVAKKCKETNNDNV